MEMFQSALLRLLFEPPLKLQQELLQNDSFSNLNKEGVNKPIFTGETGVEGFCEACDAVCKASEKGTEESRCRTMSNFLSGGALEGWNAICEQFGSEAGVNEDESAFFFKSVREFGLLYMSQDAYLRMKEYLYSREISKPAKMTINEYWKRLQTLNSYMKYLIDYVGFGKPLTERELQRIFLRGLPTELTVELIRQHNSSLLDMRMGRLLAITIAKDKVLQQRTSNQPTNPAGSATSSLLHSTCQREPVVGSIEVCDTIKVESVEHTEKVENSADHNQPTCAPVTKDNVGDTEVSFRMEHGAVFSPKQQDARHFLSAFTEEALNNTSVIGNQVIQCVTVDTHDPKPTDFEEKCFSNRIPLPTDMGGFCFKAHIMGRGGKKIKAIQSATGCKIDFRGRGSENGGDGPLHVFVSGISQESVHEGSSAILEKLEHARKILRSRLHREMFTDMFVGASDTFSNKITLDDYDERCIGNVVGSCWTTLNHLRACTNCDIELFGQGRKKCFLIVGKSQNNVDAATKVIKQLLERLSSHTKRNRYELVNEVLDAAGMGLGDGMARRVVVPVEENPGMDFYRLIVGPEGSTIKGLRARTRCTVELRGKGSRNRKGSGIEPLHVFIRGEKECVENAEAAVKKLLSTADGVDQYQPSQSRKRRSRKQKQIDYFGEDPEIAEESSVDDKAPDSQQKRQKTQLHSSLDL